MKKLTVCFVLIFALVLKDVSAGKKMKGMLEAGLLMAGLMPHPMPIPIPLPIPIRIERQHHHPAQHCHAHHHIHTEFIPFPVETKVKKPKFPKKKAKRAEVMGGDDDNYPAKP